MKRHIDATIKINAYEIVARAVESGANYGIRRAFKHTNEPSHESIVEDVLNAVMNELCEVLNFHDEGPADEQNTI